ncbi:MAG TPA: DUF502 domain-containing protein [Rhizomicrobium sp.]|nr:DUF502 domain-containing protein [Rhizomicrobium sp.]
MTDQPPPRDRRFQANFQKNLIAGLLTIIPLVVVWLVFDFFLQTLSDWGRPFAAVLAQAIEQQHPAMTPVLEDGRVQWVIALLWTLLVLYVIGAVTSRVIGQTLWGYLEAVINRIPLANTVYSAARKLVDVLRTKPENAQRVVLIDFPREGAKTLGFVMRTFVDATSKEMMAAVYVPTAVNPTTGYLQLVPVAKVTPSDMTSEQAMAMIISAGAVMPANVSVGLPKQD